MEQSMIEGTSFLFSKETCFEYDGPKLESIECFLNVLTRDKNKVFRAETGEEQTTILFKLNEKNHDNLNEEQFSIQFSDDLTQMSVISADELGIIYAILHISEAYLGVDKFWFWNDCEPSPKANVKIRAVPYLSEVAKVRFRGWFINDEVLISTWKYQQSNTYVWEMAFEALIRCKGNMVIPGTDIQNPLYKDIARKMGLWITHHHAEPLGAHMFSRVYPDKNPSYSENGDLFKELWKDAIIQQQNDKVIWNIGFRGQGDRPFWADDPTFDTDEKRGALISKIMSDQYELIAQYQKDPICCVNLYGEITELYKKGLLELPPGVIKIWADSGYGKMVSRRQGNHNPRIPSIPEQNDLGPHGIYYHVTFYDLQASNHLTMLPNTTAFVNSELGEVFDSQMCEFLIVNCGNIRPHIYFLDFVSRMWNKGRVDSGAFLDEFATRYYPAYSDEMSRNINDYFDAIIQYGLADDERAGEQFYHFTIRNLAHQWIISHGKQSGKNLWWATGEIDIKEQFEWFKQKVESKLSEWDTLTKNVNQLVKEADCIEQKRINDQFLIQVLIHKNGCFALYYFSRAFEMFQEKEYREAYLLLHQAIEEIKETMNIMQEPMNEKWVGFYDNDCLTNVMLTLYTLETVQRNIRMYGDGPSFYNWEKEYLTNPEEKKVMLLTNKTKQLMDEVLGSKLLERS
ncbi:glycosyl hydrolase 115 family protein [Bacillus sp. AFS040349]|uniref:glycosyl hydrolase 115 family protein n=1 Tax=Bacillus sp. AFS040349 TaxID=2033502 RepID=UPI000BFE8147|nr:glycosyl hydrolase 115 family protein [Bacillus sp. AFS040349]PGT84879.1 hypothetical protein COD11_09760 [Bacillus sp. AFS040349]